MAKKVVCDNCGADVIVDGQQRSFYYEYDTLPFSVANRDSDDEQAIVCTSCDVKLRRQNKLPARAVRSGTA